MKIMFHRLQVIVILFFMVSCNTTKIPVGDNTSIKSFQEQNVCSTEDMKLADWGRKYIYFDCDSLFLKLSESEAIEKGISEYDYKRLSNKLREINLFLKETIDNLQVGKKLYFPVPKNRILDSLNISDKFNIELINEID